MAPEMFSTHRHDKIVRGRQCDIWAAGVTLYYLLTKKFPYNAKSVFELADSIQNK